MATNCKGTFCYNSTGNEFLEFFSKAGSLFVQKESYYGSETTAEELFKAAFRADQTIAMQLLFWLRDARGGAGNRSGFRSILNWLSKNHSDWVEKNIELIPLYGRWDDLISCIDTPCEQVAIKYWISEISNGHGLACKWAPREKSNRIVFNKLKNALGVSSRPFRQMLVNGTKVVETKMCANEWHDIEYNHVPSVAMARSNNAFQKHDPVRYEKWKNDLSDEKSGAKVHASVLFPHDVLRTLRSDGSVTYVGCYRDSQLANAQFDALPDYMDNKKMRIMPVCDFSGSMCVAVSGCIEAIDVSMSLGLYCSDRLGKENPFYRKFIPFSDDSKLVNWKNDTFSVASEKHKNGYCGSTNIRSVFDRLLEAASMFDVKAEDMPNCIMILSDMQWDDGVDGADDCTVATHRGVFRNNEKSANQTVVEKCLAKWESMGYERPKIIYWNLAGYAGSPAKHVHDNVALVSGFSPSILKSILAGEDFSPISILMKTIEKYVVTVP